MSLLTDLEERLIAAGVTTSIALARVPDDPDEVIALRETRAGPSRDMNASGLPALESRAVQVFVRAGKDSGVATAEAIADTVFRALSGRHFVHDYGSDPREHYDWVLANHLPHHLGFDENDRPIVVMNFRVQRWGDVT